MSDIIVGTITLSSGVKLPVYSTANRPLSEENGSLIFNSTSKSIEIWEDTIWKKL
jgi:hypothetical protein